MILHLHTSNYINNLITKYWSEDNFKNKSLKNENTANNDTETKNNNISIYPNPTNGVFKINLKSQISILNTQISVTDLTGKIVYLKNNTTGNKIQIDISKENPGIYILKINTENNILTHKIIKQ